VGWVFGIITGWWRVVFLSDFERRSLCLMLVVCESKVRWQGESPRCVRRLDSFVMERKVWSHVEHA